MKQYYLQDSRQYAGNAVMWWAQDGKGYTSQPSLAHVYTAEDIINRQWRKTDIFWPKDFVDQNLMSVFDHQNGIRLDDEWKRKNGY